MWGKSASAVGAQPLDCTKVHKDTLEEGPPYSGETAAAVGATSPGIPSERAPPKWVRRFGGGSVT